MNTEAEDHVAGKIILTEMDFDRIISLIRRIRGNPDLQYVIHLLAFVIWQAQVVPALDIPTNIVTLNSRVRLRDRVTGKVTTVELVLPEEAAQDRRKTPVTTPIGALVIGRREGEIVSKVVANKEINLHIEKIIFQPESAVRNAAV